MPLEKEKWGSHFHAIPIGTGFNIPIVNAITSYIIKVHTCPSFTLLIVLVIPVIPVIPILVIIF